MTTTGSKSRTGKPGQLKVNHLAYAIAIKMMFGYGATAAEISERTGLGIKSIWQVIRVFRMQKICHVTDWHLDKCNRYTIGRYGLGNLPDKPKPLRRRLRESD